MARNKLYKYQSLKESSFVFENSPSQPLDTAGKWSNIFGNHNPIILEVACGYGEYTIGLAKQNPDYNYIGLDIKGDRLFQGLQLAKLQGLNNVRFIRSRAEDLATLFKQGEISTIWITHPDPQPKKERKRLVYKRFTEIYRNLLQPTGHLYLRTDNNDLFEYSIHTFQANPSWVIKYFSWDYYNSPWFLAKQNFLTRYEKQFSHSKIKLLHLALAQQKN